MADHIRRHEIIIVPAQKMQQSLNLAGGTCEQHGPTGLQCLFRLPEAISHMALQVFAALKPWQIPFTVDCHVNSGLAVLCHSSTKDQPALGKGLPGQLGENAAGGALRPVLIWPVGGKGLRLPCRFRLSVRDGADLFTQAAGDTLLGICLGVIKSFCIPHHGDAAFGANLDTGGTAAAVFFPCHINHGTSSSSFFAVASAPEPFPPGSCPTATYWRCKPRYTAQFPQGTARYSRNASISKSKRPGRRG